MKSYLADSALPIRQVSWRLAGRSLGGRLTASGRRMQIAFNNLYLSAGSSFQTGQWGWFPGSAKEQRSDVRKSGWLTPLLTKQVAGCGTHWMKKNGVSLNEVKASVVAEMKGVDAYGLLRWYECNISALVTMRISEYADGLSNVLCKWDSPSACQRTGGCNEAAPDIGTNEAQRKEWCVWGNSGEKTTVGWHRSACKTSLQTALPVGVLSGVSSPGYRLEWKDWILICMTEAILTRLEIGSAFWIKRSSLNGMADIRMRKRKL